MLALGVILIIAGSILVSIPNVPKERIASELVRGTEREWSVSANLNQGDAILIEIGYGDDWPPPGYFEPDPENPGINRLFVLVDIKDPSGSTTQFEVVYISSVNVTLAIWNVNVTQQGGIDATALYNEDRNTYTGIGGIVAYSGTHTASLSKEGIYPSRNDPPSYLRILKGIRLTEYPYVYFLPAGIVMGIVGAGASIFGWASTPRRRHPKKKKTPHI